MKLNHDLTQSEIDNYITTNVIPSFMPLLTKNIRSIIWRCNGNPIIATEKLAFSLGFTNYQQISNQKTHILADFSTLLSKTPIIKTIYKMFSTSQENKFAALKIMKKLSLIRDEVNQTQMPINAVLIHPFQKFHETVLLLQYVPIFHPNGQIVAIQSYIRDFSLWGVNDYLFGYGNGLLDIHQTIMDTAKLPFKLTARQHEIVFLLANGMSQKYTAEILNINRGTVSKMVSQIICPKFGINDANSQLLIEKARELNLHKNLPAGLCKPGVIIFRDKDEE